MANSKGTLTELQTRQIMPVGGDFVSFFRSGGQSLH